MRPETRNRFRASSPSCTSPPRAAHLRSGGLEQRARGDRGCGECAQVTRDPSLALVRRGRRELTIRHISNRRLEIVRDGRTVGCRRPIPILILLSSSSGTRSCDFLRRLRPIGAQNAVRVTQYGHDRVFCGLRGGKGAKDRRRCRGSAGPVIVVRARVPCRWLRLVEHRILESVLRARNDSAGASDRHQDEVGVTRRTFATLPRESANSFRSCSLRGR